MTQVNCSDSEDHCAKEDVKAEISGQATEGFGKGCAKSSDCSAKNCKNV